MTVDPRTAKAAVRDYFDRDADDYLRAYDVPANTTRSAILRERRQLVLGMLRDPIGRSLDVGAGPAVFTRSLLDRNATCWTMDLSRRMVSTGKMLLADDPRAHRATFLVGDIERLPFASRSFNTVLCIGVLQYLDRSNVALEELARVVAPAGQVVISFPNRRSPLNRLHRFAVATVRRFRATLRAVGVNLHFTPSRLTFREDIPNSFLSLGEIKRAAMHSGLHCETVAYHSLHFPFSIPGLSGVLRGWDRLASRIALSGPLRAWGREVIVRLVHPG